MICRGTIRFYTFQIEKQKHSDSTFPLHFDNAKTLYLSKLNFILSWIILTLDCIRFNTVFKHWIPYITGILFIQNQSLLMLEMPHTFNAWHLMLVSYRAWEDSAMLNPGTCSKCEIQLASTEMPGTVQPWKLTTYQCASLRGNYEICHPSATSMCSSWISDQQRHWPTRNDLFRACLRAKKALARETDGRRYSMTKLEL